MAVTWALAVSFVFSKVADSNMAFKGKMGKYQNKKICRGQESETSWIFSCTWTWYGLNKPISLNLCFDNSVIHVSKHEIKVRLKYNWTKAPQNVI